MRAAHLEVIGLEKHVLVEKHLVEMHTALLEINAS